MEYSFSIMKRSTILKRGLRWWNKKEKGGLGDKFLIEEKSSSHSSDKSDDLI